MILNKSNNAPLQYRNERVLFRLQSYIYMLGCIRQICWFFVSRRHKNEFINVRFFVHLEYSGRSRLEPFSSLLMTEHTMTKNNLAKLKHTHTNTKGISAHASEGTKTDISCTEIPKTHAQSTLPRQLFLSTSFPMS